MDLKTILLTEGLAPLLKQSGFGLEKECIRVDRASASLSLKAHPEALGDKNHHPYIQTDYSESQPEIITPPLAPFEKALEFMQATNDVLYRTIAEDELLWVNSIPGHLPEDESQIPISETEDEETIAYREYTGKKYGRSRQLMSGLHINFSLPDELIHKLFDHQEELESLKEFKNYLYMKLARNFISHSWLLIYFYGATPIAKASYFTKSIERGEPTPTRPMRSIRNSTYGYFNSTDVTVRYDDIENYIYDIESSVASQKLAAEREYYSGVRLRTPLGKQLSHLFESGIEYLEFRSLDLNPYSATGLTEDEGRFLQLFIAYLLFEDEQNPNSLIGLSRAVEVAEENPLEETAYLAEGLQIIGQMEQLIYDLDWTDDQGIIEKHRQMLYHPELTVAGQMMSAISDEASFIDFHLDLAESYRKSALEDKRDYQYLEIKDFEGFENGLRQGLSWSELQDYVD